MWRNMLISTHFHHLDTVSSRESRPTAIYDHLFFIGTYKYHHSGQTTHLNSAITNSNEKYFF